MKEYKGIYYDDDTQPHYYEGGAHFKYVELYKRLTQLLKEEQKKNKDIEKDKEAKKEKGKKIPKNTKPVRIKNILKHFINNIIY